MITTSKQLKSINSLDSWYSLETHHAYSHMKKVLVADNLESLKTNIFTDKYKELSVKKFLTKGRQN